VIYVKFLFFYFEFCSVLLYWPCVIDIALRWPFSPCNKLAYF